MRTTLSALLVVAFATACGGTSDENFTANIPEALGCDTTKLLQNPSDPTERGPFPVGAKTIMVNGLLTEVWYPAVRGSQVNVPLVTYDLRLELPPTEQGKIPDSANDPQPCDCYRDLPLDETHGPYPVIVFLHGTASFRHQSLHQVVHWAGRGFVVVAQDHPGLKLADVLVGNLDFKQQALDAHAMLASLVDTPDDLSFLSGHIDNTRRAVSGHSAGAESLQTLSSEPGVQVLIPMAGAGAMPGTSLQTTLIMGALDDSIVPIDNQETGFDSTPAPRRLVALKNAGHLAFSDICAIAVKDGGILALAQKYGVDVPGLIATLATDGCGATQLPPADGWRLINYASTPVLESQLQCSAHATSLLPSIKKQPNIGEYKEALQ